MELRTYLNLVRRWLWLILLLMILFGALAFIYTRTLPARYQASSTILVGSALVSSDPNPSLILTWQQLAEHYAQIIKTYAVLEATVRELQLPFSPDELSGYFTTRLTPNTSLLVITVTYTDPVLAADIANMLANQLIANSPSNTSEQQEQISLLRTEISNGQAQLQTAREEISRIDQQLNQTPPPLNEADLRARRDSLLKLVTDTTANIAALSQTLNDVQSQGNANTLYVIEQARIPTVPSAGGATTTIVMAVVLGLVLGALVGFVVEYLRDTIRTPAEIAPLLGVPLLGTIAPFGRKGSYKDKLIVWKQPKSTVAEAYRTVRVNLTYNSPEAAQDEHRVYVVSSPNPSEGKSVTTANLAVAFANTGLRVLLIDADLRRPSQHLIFGIEDNSLGLSNILSNSRMTRAQLEETEQVQGGGATDVDEGSFEAEFDLRSRASNFDQSYIRLLVSHLIKPTDVPGLDLIVSGPTPTNPAELLGTLKMQALVRTLSTDIKYDMVMFDTPPLLPVSDSIILANVAQAKVVMVLEAGSTRRAVASRAVQQVIGLSIPIAGVILNRINPREINEGYGYYYGYYGYGGASSQLAVTERPIPAPILPRIAPPSNGAERDYERSAER
jgi:Mrp family chromosome partitioning ATPase